MQTLNLRLYCYKFSLLIIGITTINLFGCSNTYYPNNISNSSITGDVVYGSKPGNSFPAPQTKPVNIKGVKGAKITNEKYSSRGNKDYTVLGKTYKVWRDIDSYYEEGIASWYGPGFHGQNTSNGEHYNMSGYTAAHKNLPLPSFLKVTNLSNNKSVIVRVNDRGPFHENRILDLSKGAAQEIGVIGPGTAKVRLELIKTVPNNQQTSMAVMNGFKEYIQVFSTSDYNKAISIKNTIQKATKVKTFIEQINNTYRITVGPLTEKNANSTLKTIKDIGYSSAFFLSK
ncbi:MAG: septal ring lytic transglycosylase RlpA family protein [Succinivibrionaceae bacterium]